MEYRNRVSQIDDAVLGVLSRCFKSDDLKWLLEQPRFSEAAGETVTFKDLERLYDLAVEMLKDR
jgi:hypothetical protein